MDLKTILISTILVLIGYLMGRFARPKIYHGHIQKVTEKRVPKEFVQHLESRVNKAFSHSRKPIREVKG